MPTSTYHTPVGYAPGSAGMTLKVRNSTPPPPLHPFTSTGVAQCFSPPAPTPSVTSHQRFVPNQLMARQKWRIHHFPHLWRLKHGEDLPFTHPSPQFRCFMGWCPQHHATGLDLAGKAQYEHPVALRNLLKEAVGKGRLVFVYGHAYGV